MGFDKRSRARRYTPQDGDTLKTIAERETAAGNPVTWQELGLFNFGTDDPETLEEYLRDELGCRRRDTDKCFTIATDDTPRSGLLIPIPFQKMGLAVMRTHQLRVRKQTSPPQFEDCASIPGITFDFAKSFIRPSVVDSLKPVQTALDANPGAKVMIFGHTDKVGSRSVNKGLSERRAKSVFAFMTDDPDVWEALQGQEGWGTLENQQILSYLNDTQKPANSYDPGPIDGIDGPRTRQAVKHFQGDHALMVDGVAGPKTRRELYLAYMTGAADVKISVDQFMDLKHMGCAEYNPLQRNQDHRGADGREPDSADSDERMEVNRRVTFYLFNPDRLPNLPCAEGSLTPCEQRITPAASLHNPSFSCSFYDSLAKHCKCDGGVPVVSKKLLEWVPAAADQEACALIAGTGGAGGTTPARRCKVDHHFAPKAETLDLNYNIRGHAAHKVTIEIRSERAGAEPVFSRELTGAEKADGKDKRLTWDGSTTVAGGDLKGKLANPLFAPYRAKLVAATGESTEEAEVLILYHSIKLGLGKHTPDGAAPDEASDTNRWAQFQLNEKGFNAGAVDGVLDTITGNALRRFQRSHYVAGTQTLLTENGTLDADTRAALKAAPVRAQFETGKDPLSADTRFWVHDDYYNDSNANLVTTTVPEFNSTDRKRYVEDKMERAFIPLEIEILLLGKANGAISSPEAVGKVLVAWEADDGSEDDTLIPAATNATARTYVERARRFGNQAALAAATRRDTNGDNCPKTLNGFREATAADTIKAWYPNDARSKLAPFTIKGYGPETRDGKQFHQARVEAWDHDTDHPRCRGRAGIYLRMSTKGGDDVKLRGALTFEGQPNKDKLDKLHESWRARLAKETGRWTVYRRSTMAGYCQQAVPTRASGSPTWATLNGWWSQAFYDFENNGNPLQTLTYGTVVPEATYKAAILAMPATHRPAGVTNAASLTYRPAAMYGGPAIAQARGESAAAYINRATAAMRAWVTNPINAILGVIHDHVRKTTPEGLIVFDFRIHDPLTAQDWDAATASFKPTTNPAAVDVPLSTAGYVRASGAVTMCVDNPFNVDCYVLHECGHARFLYHHKTGGGGAANPSDNPTHHDADQERCAMSYAVGGDAPNAWFYPFCGKCILRLRGWEVTTLPNHYTP